MINNNEKKLEICLALLKAINNNEGLSLYCAACEYGVEVDFFELHRWVLSVTGSATAWEDTEDTKGEAKVLELLLADVKVSDRPSVVFF